MVSFFYGGAPLCILLLLALGLWVWNLRLRARLRGMAMDIDRTDRERAERELRESEEQYRRLFESLIDVYYRIDSEGKLTLVSPSITKAIGYLPEEVLGRDVRMLYMHPEERERFLWHLSKTGYLDDYEIQIKKKDGSALWAAFNARITKDSAGNLLGTEGMARDITERKRSEEVLRREYTFRNAVINNAAEGLCVCHEIAERPFLEFTIWNDRMTEITGYTLTEINRLGWHQAVYPDPDIQAKAIERMKRMRQGEDLHAEEWEITRADGENRILNISSSIVASDDGQAHVLALMHDITERKRVEAALVDSEDKFRSYAEQALAGIYLIQDGVFKYVNPKFAEMFGCTLEECLNDMPFTRLVYPEDIPLVAAQVQKRISGRIGFVHYTFRGVHKDGRIFPVEIYGSSSVHKGRPAAAGTILDITERRAAEEALRAALKEKEVLLREIHHRVKNNMQVISSLLSLQADGVENEQVRQVLLESQQRIAAMAMIHEALYGRQNLATIDLSAYLNNLTQHLRGGYGPRTHVVIQLEIEKIEVGIDQAVPCGLIVTELVSNALKYAFASGNEGEIRISAARKGDGTMELTVSDTGVGLAATVDPKTSKTLGMRLVTELVESQLEGTWTVARNGGTRWIIRWPVAEH